MSDPAGCAAFTIEEWTILANPVSWTSMYPYTAHLASCHGGTWLLRVHPAKDRTRWAWSVQHSESGKARRIGMASTPNFAKSQAEKAAADLDGSSAT